ncbi:hypothetical protein XELAEV_18022447mg [Xenopus laevis]|uniref:Reverse transcriptase zinc-binding domain-containing protein n=1 Tax=Xenopus laevis TaxID=8355 RepID=A0A974HN69_XENLA|nr:hypothetical protein XELAEV_18022447mg [Xenopus laevis]
MLSPIQFMVNPNPGQDVPLQALLQVPIKDNRPKVNPILGNVKWVFAKTSQIIANVDPSTPLWDNTKLYRVAELNPPQSWIDRGICIIADVWQQNKPITFQELKQRWDIPSSHWLFYMSLRPKLVEWHKTRHLEPRDHLVIALLNLNKSQGMISKICKLLCMHRCKEKPLKCREQWETDLGELTDTEWSIALKAPSLISFIPRHKIMQLYMLHRAYYTRSRLSKMYPILTPQCLRCKQAVGDLMHTLWSCPGLQEYWKEALNVLEEIKGQDNLYDPKLCLLNIQSGNGQVAHPTPLLSKALFQIRRLITIYWKMEAPPNSSPMDH